MNLLLYENVGDTAVDNVCHFLCADFAVGIHPMFQNAYKTGSKKRKVICDLLHIGNAGIAAERFDEFPAWQLPFWFLFRGTADCFWCSKVRPPLLFQHNYVY